jgi:hypothetical protein
VTCRNLRVKERLPDFLSGTLSPEEAEKIRDHLALCAECREELDLVKSFASDPCIEPPSHFRVVLPKRDRTYSGLWGRRFALPFSPVWIGGFAAAVLALFILGPWRPFPTGVDEGLFDRYLLQPAQPPILGLGEMVLSQPGLQRVEVDRELDREIALTDELEEIFPSVSGFSPALLEGMDEETIRIFEGLLDEITPYGKERG